MHFFILQKNKELGMWFSSRVLAWYTVGTLFPSILKKAKQQQNKTPTKKSTLIISNLLFGQIVNLVICPGIKDLLTNYGINAFITKSNLRIPKTLFKIHSGINTQELQFSANWDLFFEQGFPKCRDLLKA